MTRRALVSPRLPELRSGNAELDRWVARYLQEFVATVFEKTKSLTPERGEFAPAWLGFSTDPAGNISYMDSGDRVEMWVDATLTGVSDEAFMVLSGVPQALWPSADRYCRCPLLDESNLRGGAVVLGSTGIMTFALERVAASPANTIEFAAIFTDPSALGFKGLPSGWIIQYAK